MYFYVSALWELNLKKYFPIVSFALQSLEAIKREEKDNGGIYILMVLLKMFENVDLCFGDGIIDVLICQVVYISNNCQLWQGFLLLAASFPALIS